MADGNFPRPIFVVPDNIVGTRCRAQGMIWYDNIRVRRRTNIMFIVLLRGRVMCMDHKVCISYSLFDVLCHLRGEKLPEPVFEY